jgi:hypothetical protein
MILVAFNALNGITTNIVRQIRRHEHMFLALHWRLLKSTPTPTLSMAYFNVHYTESVDMNSCFQPCIGDDMNRCLHSQRQSWQ